MTTVLPELGALLADGGTSGAIVVAQPSLTDGVRVYCTEGEPHVTLAYLGDAEGMDPGLAVALAKAVGDVAALVPRFTAHVSGYGRLGDNDAAVLILEAQELADLRDSLLANPMVLEAMEGVEDKFPNFIPHLTLGYGDEVDLESLELPESVEIDSLGVWIAESHATLMLADPDKLVDMMSDDADDESTEQIHEEIDVLDLVGLIPYGVTAAGKFNESLHPRGKDGRFINKFGIIKWLDKIGHWNTGIVTGIDYSPGSTTEIDISATPSDLAGHPNGGDVVILHPNQVYEAPKAIAHLPIAHPDSNKVGNQAGSNPGGFYQLGKDGKFYVKKAQTAKHGRNEALANDLYAAAGVPVPAVDYNEEDGYIYSQVSPGKMDMADRLDDIDWVKSVNRDFAVDAWLANWDVFGMTWDNVKTYDEDGVAVRIDNGGALLYRAQGDPKGDAFTGKVTELDSFKKPTKKMKAIVGPDKMTLEDEIDGATRILAISPGQIEDMVAEHKLPKSLADTLKARRLYIADYYKLTPPEALKPVDTDQVATLAPTVDPADLSISKGKSRDWQSMNLLEAGFILQTGDIIALPDNSEVTFGYNEYGEQTGPAAAKSQLLYLEQTWGSERVLVKQSKKKYYWSSQEEKQRPVHGETITPLAMGDYYWQRGDKVVDSEGTELKVLGTNYNGGVVLVRPSDGKAYLVDVDSSTPYTVKRWDPPAPVEVKDQAVLNTPPLEEWEAELLGESQAYPPSTADFPDGPIDPGKPLPSEGQALQDLYNSLLPPAVPAAPTGLAEPAKESIKADLVQPVAAKPGDKTMLLGDGTTASPGDEVVSKVDGKTYIFVKPKGPYAAVTDPDLPADQKPKTKNASSLTQPDKTAGKIGKVILPAPLTADGKVPFVGMSAKAKDGHEGKITMVSPDGKFVFITDVTGKKKRKSTGTVTITDDNSGVNQLQPQSEPDPAAELHKAQEEAQAKDIEKLKELLQPVENVEIPETAVDTTDEEAKYVADWLAAGQISVGDKIKGTSQNASWFKVTKVDVSGIWVLPEYSDSQKLGHKMSAGTAMLIFVQHGPPTVADNDLPAGTAEKVSPVNPLEDLPTFTYYNSYDNHDSTFVQLSKDAGTWALIGDDGKISTGTPYHTAYLAEYYDYTDDQVVYPAPKGIPAEVDKPKGVGNLPYFEAGDGANTWVQTGPDEWTLLNYSTGEQLPNATFTTEGLSAWGFSPEKVQQPKAVEAPAAPAVVHSWYDVPVGARIAVASGSSSWEKVGEDQWQLVSKADDKPIAGVNWTDQEMIDDYEFTPEMAVLPGAKPAELSQQEGPLADLKGTIKSGDQISVNGGVDWETVDKVQTYAITTNANNYYNWGDGWQVLHKPATAPVAKPVAVPLSELTAQGVLEVGDLLSWDDGKSWDTVTSIGGTGVGTVSANGYTTFVGGTSAAKEVLHKKPEAPAAQDFSAVTPAEPTATKKLGPSGLPVDTVPVQPVLTHELPVKVADYLQQHPKSKVIKFQVDNADQKPTYYIMDPAGIDGLKAYYFSTDSIGAQSGGKVDNSDQAGTLLNAFMTIKGMDGSNNSTMIDVTPEQQKAVNPADIMGPAFNGYTPEDGEKIVQINPDPSMSPLYLVSDISGMYHEIFNDGTVSGVSLTLDDFAEDEVVTVFPPEAQTGPSGLPVPYEPAAVNTLPHGDAAYGAETGNVFSDFTTGKITSVLKFNNGKVDAEDTWVGITPQGGAISYNKLGNEGGHSTENKIMQAFEGSKAMNNNAYLVDITPSGAATPAAPAAPVKKFSGANAIDPPGIKLIPEQKERIDLIDPADLKPGYEIWASGGSDYNSLYVYDPSTQEAALVYGGGDFGDMGSYDLSELEGYNAKKVEFKDSAPEAAKLPPFAVGTQTFGKFVPAAGDTVVLNANGTFSIKKAGQSMWFDRHPDGTDTGDTWSDSTIQWGMEHAGTTVVFGEFNGKSASQVQLISSDNMYFENGEILNKYAAENSDIVQKIDAIDQLAPGQVIYAYPGGSDVYIWDPSKNGGDGSGAYVYFDGSHGDWNWDLDEIGNEGAVKLTSGKPGTAAPVAPAAPTEPWTNSGYKLNASQLKKLEAVKNLIATTPPWEVYANNDGSNGVFVFNPTSGEAANVYPSGALGEWIWEKWEITEDGEQVHLGAPAVSTAPAQAGWHTVDGSELDNDQKAKLNSLDPNLAPGIKLFAQPADGHGYVFLFDTNSDPDLEAGHQVTSNGSLGTFTYDFQSELSGSDGYSEPAIEVTYGGAPVTVPAAPAVPAGQMLPLPWKSHSLQNDKIEGLKKSYLPDGYEIWAAPSEDYYSVYAVDPATGEATLVVTPNGELDSYSGYNMSDLTDDFHAVKVEFTPETPAVSTAPVVGVTPAAGNQPIKWSQSASNVTVPDPSKLVKVETGDALDIPNGEWIYYQAPGSVHGNQGMFLQQSFASPEGWVGTIAAENDMSHNMLIKTHVNVATDGTIAGVAQQHAIGSDGMPFALDTSSGSLYVDPKFITKKAAPAPAVQAGWQAPETPAYPGSKKPTANEIAAWGAPLTKDGYIPTSGMHVMGKGPMTGVITSVNKNAGTATVVMDSGKGNGKKSVRKIDALKVDVSANYLAYSPKSSVKDVPKGMALAVDPPGEAITKTLEDGKFRPIVSDATGVRWGEIVVTKAMTPSGKKVARIHLTLTKEQRAKLVTKLSANFDSAAPQQPIGGWVSKSIPTDSPAVGHQFAMRTSSSQGWWIDKNGTKPTHTVSKVEPHPDGETGVLSVTMTNDANGDEIVVKFNPGHSIKSWTWDPTIMPPPPAVGAFNLGALAQAQGWKKKTGDGGIVAVFAPGSPHNQGKGSATGDGILGVEPGADVPGNLAAIEHTLSGRKVLRKVSQDGVVIEVIGADSNTQSSVNGVTCITLPDGATEQQLAGAMADLGIDYAPMTREGAKRAARGQLHNQLNFGASDVDTAGGWSDEKLFQVAGETLGITDLGWHDVFIGTDESTGKVTFWWSQRVHAAIASKSKHDLVIRGTKGHSADSVANNLLFGGAGGIQRRVTGMIAAPGWSPGTGGIGISAGQDSGNMAGAGSFTSITHVGSGTLPAHNPHWSTFSGATVYHRPEAILGRIQDTRAGSGDAFGLPGQGTNTLKKALNSSSVGDYYVGGGTPAESVAFVAVKSPTYRTDALNKLHSLGIHEINGRPIEQIMILQSDVTKMHISDLPPVGPPANARNILDLPEVYEEEAPVPAVEEVVAAA